MQSYMLFDAAVLRGADFLLSLVEHPDAHYLYREWGARPAMIGPILLPYKKQVHLEVSQLAKQDLKFAFGFSLLRTNVNIQILEQHLLKLRFLHTLNDQRYYLRFADGRLSASVWQALTPEQREHVLGPIDEWNYSNQMGTDYFVQTSGLSVQYKTETLFKLALRPQQFHKILRVTRIGELFSNVLRVEQLELAPKDYAHHYALTVQTFNLLEQLKIHAPQIKMATVAVVWQTKGLALKHSALRDLLSHVQLDGDIHRIHRFGDQLLKNVRAA